MKEKIKKAARFLGRWALLICGLVLVVASGFHRLQLDTAMPEAYTSSLLVPIEIMLILIMCLFLVVHFVRSISLILNKQWRELGILSVATVVGLICMVAALQIDTPTLLYRT
jgi:hypothetical protein